MGQNVWHHTHAEPWLANLADPCLSRPAVPLHPAGPVTILQWSFPRADVTRREQVRPPACKHSTAALVATLHLTHALAACWVGPR